MLYKLLSKPLDPELQEKLIQEASAKFFTLKGIQKLYLIGSAARREMQDTSDLDFLVVLENEETLRQAQKLYYSTPPVVDWPIDIVWLDEATFVRNSAVGGVSYIAVREGVLLIDAAN